MVLGEEGVPVAVAARLLVAAVALEVAAACMRRYIKRGGWNVGYIKQNNHCLITAVTSEDRRVTQRKQSSDWFLAFYFFERVRTRVCVCEGRDVPLKEVK